VDYGSRGRECRNYEEQGIPDWDDTGGLMEVEGAYKLVDVTLKGTMKRSNPHTLKYELQYTLLTRLRRPSLFDMSLLWQYRYCVSH